MRFRNWTAVSGNFIRGKENKSRIFLFLPNFFRLVEIYSLWKIIKVNIRIKRNIGKLRGQRSWKYTRQGLKEFRMYRWGKRLTAPWIIRLKEWKSTRHGIEINLYLSLSFYTVTYNAIYEREREREAYRERRTMMRSFFQQELLNAKYPSVRTQRRKNFRKLVKVQWPGSTVSALPFIEIVFKNLKRKEKKKKGDYNNASR